MSLVPPGLYTGPSRKDFQELVELEKEKLREIKKTNETLEKIFESLESLSVTVLTKD